MDQEEATGAQSGSESGSAEEFTQKAMRQATKRKFDYSFSSSSDEERKQDSEEEDDDDESADEIKEALLV